MPSWKLDLQIFQKEKSRLDNTLKKKMKQRFFTFSDIQEKKFSMNKE